MEHSNHWYGHSRILADYCGIAPGTPPRLWAALQHGWNIEHGFGRRHHPHPGFPRLAWSDVALRRAQSRGWRDCVAIGAPWNYLRRMSEPPPAERSGTLFYPFHAWDHGSVDGGHQALIDEVRATESGEVTACLYWLEYDNEAIRSAYERAGFRVIFHGYRGHTRHDVDTEFLRRQYDELSRHRRVISNRLTTAVLYGIDLGCEAGVYGDPMLYDEGGYASDTLPRSLRLYPEMHAPVIDPRTAAAFASEELGTGLTTSPEEIRLLVGWEDPA